MDIVNITGVMALTFSQDRTDKPLSRRSLSTHVIWPNIGCASVMFTSDIQLCLLCWVGLSSAVKMACATSVGSN